MSASAKSVLVHGIYLAVLGAALVLVPKLALGLLGLPEATDVWVRVTGALTFLLGYYYIQAARKEVTEFMHLTIHARSMFALFSLAFVLLGLARPGLLLAGVLDLLGALWTWLALRTVRS
jgi:hypothetical protein